MSAVPRPTIRPPVAPRLRTAPATGPARRRSARGSRRSARPSPRCRARRTAPPARRAGGSSISSGATPRRVQRVAQQPPAAARGRGPAGSRCRRRRGSSTQRRHLVGARVEPRLHLGRTIHGANHAVAARGARPGGHLTRHLRLMVRRRRDGAVRRLSMRVGGWTIVRRGDGQMTDRPRAIWRAAAAVVFEIRGPGGRLTRHLRLVVRQRREASIHAVGGWTIVRRGDGQMARTTTSEPPPRGGLKRAQAPASV